MNRRGEPPSSGTERDPDLVDSVGELLVLTDHPRELSQIVPAYCEDLAVEVLALHLDRCEEPLDHVTFGTIEISKSCEIDRDRLPLRINHHRCGFGWKQLDHRNAVVAGQSMKARNREASLATFIRTEYGRLELTLRDALHVLE